MTTQDTDRRLALVKSATSGVLADLECPSCRRKSVTVRSTHPVGSEYRTWFLCRSCDFTMRAQNSGVPAHFSQGRVGRFATEKAGRGRTIPLTPWLLTEVQDVKAARAVPSLDGSDPVFRCAEGST